MIDMTLDENDKRCYIIDFQVNDEELYVTRANGEIYVLSYTEHNLNSLRFAMIRQVREYSQKYIDVKEKESLDLLISEVRTFICGIIALFFLYSIDIHIIIKIILTIIVVLFELFYGLVKFYDICMLGEEFVECEALETYIENIDTFSYTNSSYDIVYRLPIEDISKCGFSKEDLENFVREIQCFKLQGVEDEDISLDYKKLIKENTSPKIMI